MTHKALKLNLMRPHVSKLDYVQLHVIYKQSTGHGDAIILKGMLVVSEPTDSYPEGSMVNMEFAFKNSLSLKISI